jgi:zinc transport system permease protein
MLHYEFMRNALLVSLFVAVLCPCIGVFLVLRRYSMIGDTLSHASLAGIAASLALGGTPILGAFAFTTVCGALIVYLRKRIKQADLVLSVVLALCVGIAVTLISTGKLGASADSFMFGSILTVSRADLLLTLALSVLAVAALFALYDRMLFIAYDDEAARIAGVRVELFNYVFMVLVAAAVSVSIHVVGVLVLSSMIALPVAAALQLGRGFRATLIASVAFSVFDIMAGLYIAYYLNVAPGGMTAIISVVTLFGVILAKRLMRSAKGGAAR